ncbi:hypothetical protein D3C71_2039130 [compost metagenome]
MAHHEVHGLAAGLAQIALLVDHHAHLDAALLRRDQRLHDVLRLERIGQHLDAALRAANGLQHQRPGRAFGREADLDARLGMG